METSKRIKLNDSIKYDDIKHEATEAVAGDLDSTNREEAVKVEVK